MLPKTSVMKALLALLVLGAIYWFGLRTDPAVDALNQALQQHASRAFLAYPYQFRVVQLKEGVATISSPRSAEMPVYRMIGAIDSSLAGKDATDPDFIAAQKQLATMQGEARQIVIGQPGVTGVKWELDKNWLSERGILLD
ncbi:MAG: hypothetical protein P4L77_01405 [Sulfuriferula sp.]|nr:hypothetical protein [Sulfuriferula sp.]